MQYFRAFLIFAGFIACTWLWFYGIYASCRAVANRKPGVGILRAWRAIAWRHEPFTDTGSAWCLTAIRCQVGFVACVVAMVLLAALLHW